MVDTILSQIKFHPAAFEYVENASPGELCWPIPRALLHVAGPNLFLCIQNCQMYVKLKIHLVFAGNCSGRIPLN